VLVSYERSTECSRLGFSEKLRIIGSDKDDMQIRLFEEEKYERRIKLGRLTCDANIPLSRPFSAKSGERSCIGELEKVESVRYLGGSTEKAGAPHLG
jgi:hypothetical protein